MTRLPSPPPNPVERLVHGFFLLLLLLAGTGVEAAGRTVILHLKNGDRITGRVIRESDSRIVLESPLAGRLNIPAAQVDRREEPDPAPKPATVAVPTPDAPAPATPPPAPSKPVAAVPPPGKPAGGTPPEPATNAPPDLPWYSLRRWVPEPVSPFVTNWHGNLQVGMNLGFGTRDRQDFYARATATHAYGRSRNALAYNAAYGIADGRQAANRMEGTLKTDLDLWKKRKWYAYNQFLAAYDDIREINLRWDEGVGMGYKVIERARLVGNMELGAQFQQFRYDNQLGRRNIWSGRIGESLTWKPNDKLSVVQRFTFTPSFLDADDYRFRFELLATYPLYKRVTVNLNIIDDYEADPRGAVDNNELTIQGTVGIQF